MPAFRPGFCVFPEREEPKEEELLPPSFFGPVRFRYPKTAVLFPVALPGFCPDVAGPGSRDLVFILFCFSDDYSFTEENIMDSIIQRWNRP